MRFDDRVTGNLNTYALKAKKIHVDIDPSEINKNVRVDVGIAGDLRTVLTASSAAGQAQQHKDWMGCIRDWQEDADERDILNYQDG
jgi:acetolactate synthase I/II/III large subunit